MSTMHIKSYLKEEYFNSYGGFWLINMNLKIGSIMKDKSNAMPKTLTIVINFKLDTLSDMMVIYSSFIIIKM